MAGQGASFLLCSGKFAAGQSANSLCDPGVDSVQARRRLPAMESLQRGRVQSLSVLWAGTVDWQGVGFPLWKVCSGRSVNPLCAPPCRDIGWARRGLQTLLWKVCSGAECKPSLCSSRQEQWPGKAQASCSGKFAAGQRANPLCAPPGRDRGWERCRLPALLWKVCSGAECKPSLCSSRLAQWPPSTTLLWEQKPSLAAMDRWAVCPALASACELVRQVGNSQANKLHPVP